MISEARIRKRSQNQANKNLMALITLALYKILPNQRNPRINKKILAHLTTLIQHHLPQRAKRMLNLEEEDHLMTLEASQLQLKINPKSLKLAQRVVVETLAALIIGKAALPNQNRLKLKQKPLIKVMILANLVHLVQMLLIKSLLRKVNPKKKNILVNIQLSQLITLQRVLLLKAEVVKRENLMVKKKGQWI